MRCKLAKRHVGLIGAVALLLASCGGSDDSSSSGDVHGGVQPGQCVDLAWDEGPGAQPEVVPCDTPHQFEVVAVDTPDNRDDLIDYQFDGAQDQALAECLGVPVDEVNAVLAERGVRAFVYGNLLLLLLESDSGERADGSPPLEEAMCQFASGSTEGAESSPLPKGPSVPELAASEWQGFCALDPSILYAGSGDDELGDRAAEIEAALAGSGAPTSDDVDVFLAALRDLTAARTSLDDAIQDAKADQTALDCTTGQCQVLIGEQGVLLADENAFRFESGGLIALPVDDQLAAVLQAIDDLATIADDLGLDDCTVLTDESTTGLSTEDAEQAERAPQPPPTDATTTEPATIEGFEDQFDGAFGGGWVWVYEDPDLWSLTATPGWLQITAAADARNVLVRDEPQYPYEITTALRFVPTSNFQFAGLIVAESESDGLQFGLEWCDSTYDGCIGRGVYLDELRDGEWVPPSTLQIMSNLDVVYLRLVVDGNSYAAYVSEDGSSWNFVGERTRSFSDTKIGLIAHRAIDEPAVADFDYVTVTSPSDGAAPTASSVPSTMPPPTTTLADSDNLILLTANVASASEPILVEVMAGEFKLVSGTTAAEGSSFPLHESWMELTPGLGIDIGPGGLELFGDWYEAGTRLMVDPTGTLQVVRGAAAPASADDTESDLPTYSEVVAVFPAGVDPCTTEGEISGGQGGDYTIHGGAILDPDGGLFCKGSRYTTAAPTVLPDGSEVPEGSLLTIDGDGNMVQVSSFD